MSVDRTLCPLREFSGTRVGDSAGQVFDRHKQSQGLGGNESRQELEAALVTASVGSVVPLPVPLVEKRSAGSGGGRQWTEMHSLSLLGRSP